MPSLISSTVWRRAIRETDCPSEYSDETRNTNNDDNATRRDVSKRSQERIQDPSCDRVFSGTSHSYQCRIGKILRWVGRCDTTFETERLSVCHHVSFTEIESSNTISRHAHGRASVTKRHLYCEHTASLEILTSVYSTRRGLNSTDRARVLNCASLANCRRRTSLLCP